MMQTQSQQQWWLLRYHPGCGGCRLLCWGQLGLFVVRVYLERLNYALLLLLKGWRRERFNNPALPARLRHSVGHFRFWALGFFESGLEIEGGAIESNRARHRFERDTVK